MPNVVDEIMRKVVPWNGRPVIILYMGDFTECPGVLIGPEGMSVQDVLTATDRAYTEIVAEVPDFAWEYSDVFDRLRRNTGAAFELILAGEWWALNVSERIAIVHASDLPKCDCCSEPWCPVHQEHYADCVCVGPHNAEELGYDLVEENGKLFGVRKPK